MAYTIEHANNVMLGAGLKFSALATVLNQNSTDFYFPEGYWCNMVTPGDGCINATAGGVTVSLTTYASDYYVHIRDGYIVPYQNAFDSMARTTADLSNQ